MIVVTLVRAVLVGSIYRRLVTITCLTTLMHTATVLLYERMKALQAQEVPKACLPCCVLYRWLLLAVLYRRREALSNKNSGHGTVSLYE